MAEGELEMPGHESGNRAESVGRRRLVRLRGLAKLKIGALGTLVVSAIGGTFAAALGPYMTHLESAQDEVRAKRATVYPAYLDAARDYFYSTDRLAVDLEKMGKRGEVNNYKAPKAVAQEFTEFLNTRNKYQREINSLYVYGSDAAWYAHRQISRTLPQSLGNYGGESIPLPREGQFDAAYRAFQKVECHELPAVPRSGC